MPSRRTTIGTQRTPLDGSYDAIVCGASFAGLAVTRKLAGARRPDGDPARVLLLDRYEIGERQTSACATPTAWLEALGLDRSERQRFAALVMHTPRATVRFELPWTLSTFDYPQLCALMAEQAGADFEIATVIGRAGFGDPPPGSEITVMTDRGEVSAPLVVDALGWRRLLAGNGYQPPDAPLSRGLEVHPAGSSSDLEIWIDRSLVRAGYSWSFPAADEVRVGAGSFDPHRHVREPTMRLARALGRPADGYQGNWIPHRLRDATEDGVFFAGDSAGHCLPLTAEGIRTAFYFGIACGRELRAVIEGRSTRAEALARYQAFSEAQRWKFEVMLRVQRLVPRLSPPLLALVARTTSKRRFANWSFNHYLALAPPEFVRSSPPATSRQTAAAPPRSGRA